MQSPIHPDTAMQPLELEPGLSVYECPKSGGLWIPLAAFLAWKEQHPATSKSAPASDSMPPIVQEVERTRALICPESGRLLARYRVGHGLAFQIEHSPVTGGVWLDKGKWEALKSKGLHVSLNLIFTESYQRQVRSSEYAQELTDAFRQRIGATDFSKVTDFAEWLAEHPKRRDICCYLLDLIEQKNKVASTAGA
jgi:Zn-finger nucleic acid-binding protein